MRQQNYYWVTGTRRNGQFIIDGPHGSKNDAEEVAGELNGAEVHELPTRQHALAKKLLNHKGVFEPQRQNRLHTDEPEEDRGNVMDRIRGMLAGRRRDELD